MKLRLFIPYLKKKLGIASPSTWFNSGGRILYEYDLLKTKDEGGLDMNNELAIEILKTESCANCSCNAPSPIFCIHENCPVAEATRQAIKALETKED